ncbi:4-alpha-glucanotransferase [Pseudooceanicola nanhaiensis]|jgi:4-alpha-glucanotransferase|uniref:4-alpha-glucanotransferase n=1 Tax=Pseudooceanicola nanhaiensis TaxID=375761 RepID=A0A917SUY9_9RHOB|nr:4-alpha-glucanotransferase [Pseudooceanicola nanhaiensis]GGL97353.1 4-alpha-glucanotransferase [Pseudooceanicola nanhaiensis]
MTTRAALDRLAAHHGMSIAYGDLATGSPRPVPAETLRLILDGLGVDHDAAPSGAPAASEMVVPEGARCHVPASLDDAPGWGVFCQLYELRSDRNCGIGDFGDLTRLARICGAAGADFLGVNPLHALFTAAPDRASPFSPSNRRFLNPLYIALDAVPGAAEPEDAAALRSDTLVDYPAVAKAKLAALRGAFDTQPFGPDASRDSFESFVAEGGEALRLHAVFEAISGRMTAAGHGPGWRDWPAALRRPGSPEVAQLAAELADDVTFHLWLQWITRRQLHAAAEAARAAGMRIGLYLDLAVGEAMDGSSTWSGAAAALPGLSIGAPPDMFATTGQNWGLSAPSPTALAAADFAPFREMIAAQLADAGALRIDHVMALWQLFLIPENHPPADGTHLRQPFADLLRELAAQSRARQAVVIGEDLGFVPDGFRDAMETANILSYRILYFEQDDDGFAAAASYPTSALACISTHDLPVMATWWRGIDIGLREAHGLVDPETSKLHAAHRERERKGLLRALERDGGLPAGTADAAAPDLPEQALDAAHRFLARTPCLLCGVRLADLVGPTEPTNLPGTVDVYPNWRPRSPVRIEDLPEHPAFARVTALMRAERPRPERSAS